MFRGVEGLVRKGATLAGLAAVSFALAGCARTQTQKGVTVARAIPAKGTPEARVEGSRSAIGRLKTTAGEGLGFVIDPAGVILTNRHVIENGEHVVSFELPDADPPRRFEAVRVLYTDAARDLALLEVDSPDPLPSLPLATLRFEDPGDYLRAGSEVTIAAARGDASEGAEPGEAYRLERERVRAVDRRVPAVEAGPFIELAHDVVAGQSGGPVLDARGRVVGVVTWTWRHRIGGFAIPIAEVHRMLAEKPDVADPRSLERRARRRVEHYMEALESQRMSLARNLTSPTHARRVRGRALSSVMEERRGEDSVLVGWVEMLEQIVEATAGDEEAAFSALHELAVQVSQDPIAGALGIEHVPVSQRLSFFLELGQGYLAARLFGEQDMRGALVRGLVRLESLDAARSFALADILLSVSELELRLEGVEVRPGLYAPSGVAFLRVMGADGRATSQRLALELKMEWGDWYVAGLQPVSPT